MSGHRPTSRSSRVEPGGHSGGDTLTRFRFVSSAVVSTMAAVRLLGSDSSLRGSDRAAGLVALFAWRTLQPAVAVWPAKGLRRATTAELK